MGCLRLTVGLVRSCRILVKISASCLHAVPAALCGLHLQLARVSAGCLCAVSTVPRGLHLHAHPVNDVRLLCTKVCNIKDDYLILCSSDADLLSSGGYYFYLNKTK